MSQGEGMASDPTVTTDSGAGDGLRRWGPVDILSAKENRKVVMKLMRHVVAVAVGPIGTYFLVKDLHHPTDPHRDARAAVAAVLATNVLIAMYVIMAFSEDDGKSSGGEKVKRLGRWQEPRSE